MKYFELTEEEKKLLKDIETGRFVPVKKLQRAKQEITLAVKNTLGKNKNVNIRLSEKDLWKIKAKAIDEGIPYQTLTSSVLHRFAYA